MGVGDTGRGSMGMGVGKGHGEGGHEDGGGVKWGRGAWG